MLLTLIRVKGQPEEQNSGDEREHKKQDPLRLRGARAAARKYPEERIIRTGVRD